MTGAFGRSARGARWRLGMAALLICGCARSAAPARPPARHVALFVTADLQGQLTPCGCSEAMRGGLPRAAAQIQAARADGFPVALVDGGDALFERSGLSPDEKVEEGRKARTVAEAFRSMGLITRAVGPLDDAEGSTFRRALGLPETEDGTSTPFELGGHRLAVVAAKSAVQLSRGAARARGEGAQFVVALYGGPLDGAQSAAAPSSGVDLIVAAQAPRPMASGDDSVLVRGGVPVAQIQSRGRALMRVDLTFEGPPGRAELVASAGDLERELSTQASRIELLKREINLPGQSPERRRVLGGALTERIARREALAAAPLPRPAGVNAFSVRFIALESSLPGDPRVDALVDTYDREVSALNLEFARAHGRPCPPAPPGEAGYVGNEACRACHAGAFPVYESSRHAHAYATLEGVHKQYRLGCIGCHIVGIQQPGGVCRVDQVEGRRNVGCENCHGPGSIHVEEATRESIPRPAPTSATCVGCHSAENSPHFDAATYLPMVLGPGHAAHIAARPKR